MNQILSSIVVTHPCKTEAAAAQIQLQPVKDYDRSREVQEMGEFNVEEACQNVLGILGSECQFTVQDLSELNANLAQVLQSTHVQRADHVTSNANQAAGAQMAPA